MKFSNHLKYYTFDRFNKLAKKYPMKNNKF